MPGWTWGDIAHYIIDAILIFALIILWQSPAKSAGFDQRFPQVVHRISPHVKTVRASYYRMGMRTASGERFNANGVSCAHRRLPFNTVVRLTLRGRSVLCRINDRGPFIRGKEIDLSVGAARKLGMIGAGVASIGMEVLRAQ